MVTTWNILSYVASVQSTFEDGVAADLIGVVLSSGGRAFTSFWFFVGVFLIFFILEKASRAEELTGENRSGVEEAFGQ